MDDYGPIVGLLFNAAFDTYRQWEACEYFLNSLAAPADWSIEERERCSRVQRCAERWMGFASQSMQGVEEMANVGYPLAWPPGFARTTNRKTDNFAKKSDRGGMQSLTVHQAYMRVFKEAAAFTRPGHAWRLNPETLIVSSNLRVRRSDSMPESAQKAPLDPGVAVYFELDKQPYCLPCDKWNSVAGNLAAVAAHLNAIRGIERWGVGDLRAQFAGYQALPDPDRIIWRDVFGYDKHAPAPTAQELTSQFKLLRSKQHPDKGGNAQEFDRVMKAYELACKELGYDP